jgi:hypothetical protein
MPNRRGGAVSYERGTPEWPDTMMAAIEGMPRAFGFCLSRGGPRAFGSGDVSSCGEGSGLSSSPVDPSCRALSGRPKFTAAVRVQA